MDLRKKSLTANETFLEEKEYQLFQQNPEYSAERAGCFAFPRQISTGENLRITLPSTEYAFFSDVVALPKFGKSIVVRSDNELMEVKIEIGNGGKNVWSISHNG